jgi:hypothetical protein
MIKHGYMNIYRSGYFHREGKPGALDRHAGDIYTEYDVAISEIDPPSHYIATIPITWDDPENVVVNPSDSVPVSLSVSRKRFVQQLEEIQN